MECACVVCHGNMPRPARGPAGITCGNACRLAWLRQRRGVGLAAKYQDLRLAHAFRREKLAFAARVAALAGLAGKHQQEWAIPG